jgi:hypothetical protein
MKTTIIKHGTVIMATVFSIISANTAYADAPGKHPHYLHALSDLRAARWFIENRPGNISIVQKEEAAIIQIDAAFADLRQASIDDGKNLSYSPPAEVPADRVGYLHKAVEMLEAAHNDVALEEDDPFAVGLQQRSLQHIHEAAENIRHAIYDVEHGE